VAPVIISIYHTQQSSGLESFIPKPLNVSIYGEKVSICTYREVLQSLKDAFHFHIDEINLIVGFVREVDTFLVPYRPYDN
jgi:hypothetical protein